MNRLAMCTIAALCATLPGAVTAGVKYTVNGPNVLVPITDNTPQPIAPWVQGDPDLAGNIVVDDVHDYLWNFFPASVGRVQLRAVRSFKTGRIALELGIKPSATTPNVPTSLAIFGFKQLDFEIGRRFGGEKVAPKTHVRSEQNQTTKLYHLVFTFDTPLPKNKMTWFVIKTSSTKTEPGTMVTFADNDSGGSPYPKYSFVRGANSVQPKPAIKRVVRRR